jgi:hypothetical protein
MELIIIILFTAMFSISLFVAISATLTNKELRDELQTMKSCSVDREELIMKRVYKNLSDRLIEERDNLNMKLDNIRKDLFIYRRLKKRIKHNNR